MEIFVANFPEGTEEYELEQLFTKFGLVRKVTICRNGAGEPAGYGFVEMVCDSDAEFAIEQLNGRWWNRRRLKVSQKRRSNWDDWDEEDEELFRKND
jgi:RNA recognition motif-containing protein